MTSLRFSNRSNPSRPLISALLAFALLSLLSASGQDVRFYGVVKGQGFFQTNTGPAYLEGAVLQAFVSANGEDAVTNVVIRAPGGAVVPFNVNGHDDDFAQFFPSTNELNLAYADGIYTVELGTVHDGNVTNALNL